MPHGLPIGGGLAEDAEERQRVAAVKQAFDQRARRGCTSEWRSADDSGPTAIGIIGRAYDLIVMPQPGALPKMPESVFETALFDSGRPVLVVPPGFAGMVGKRRSCSPGTARPKARGRSRSPCRC